MSSSVSFSLSADDTMGSLKNLPDTGPRNFYISVGILWVSSILLLRVAGHI
jgi:hypothetical protein